MAAKPRIRVAVPKRAMRCAVAALAILFFARPVLADTLVFAAASMKNALDAVAEQYSQRTGRTVRISYAGSSALAKQIENGAPADIFLSADRDWMDYLEKRGAIRPETRQDLLGNTLVLIAPRGSDASLKIGSGFDLAGALDDGERIAMADPDFVPAGKYAKAALEILGIWNDVAPRVARADNVRAALALVARGEAPIGIVYATDALAEPAVRVLDAFPEGTHPPIVYPVAMTAGSRRPEAEDFLAFMLAESTAPLYEEHGFTVRSPMN